MEKLSVSAIYEGRTRLLCPHMLGRNRSGETWILCLQIGGESASGLAGGGQGGWRCLAMEKFSSAALEDTTWRTVPGSLRRPKCIEFMEVQVSD